MERIALSNKLKIKMNKRNIIILLVVLYGCESMVSYIKEHCIRVFENRILRRIFGQKCDENRELRRLHIEKLLNLYCSPNIDKMNISRR